MPDESGQEKTLEPTQRKIEQSHEKGEFARSKEITMLATFLIMVLFLWLGQDYLLNRMTAAGTFFLNFHKHLNLGPETITALFWKILMYTMPILLPMFGLVFFAGLAGEVAQIGFRVVKDPFEPKWNRLDPAQGFKRLFSLKQMIEGPKSLLKLSIFLFMAYITVRGSIHNIATLGGTSPENGVKYMFQLASTLAFRSCILLAFFAGFDYFFQRWQYMKKLRMTHQEMKDEMKQQEGDPALKQRMRSIQMEIARKRMMAAVPESDVVITNPTHYAVALRYDPEKDNAPVLVAKGQNYIAHKIKDLARASGVPILENPPLARAIYKQTEIDQAIPGGLFKAVAQILASIWALSAQRGRTWARPAA